VINVLPHAVAISAPDAVPAGAPFTFTLRAATPDDAPAIDALIGAHQAEGHLLPRQVDEIRARAARFLVAEVDQQVKACAELVPLSTRLAEVRSLVVAAEARRHGLATRLVDALAAEARSEGFSSLLALAHDPRFFIRHDFSIVPHEWLSEKIARDCHACALFRNCGQQAMLLSLAARPSNAVTRTPHVAVAVA
jgi:amino-acid N-acetyltransferase